MVIVSGPLRRMHQFHFTHRAFRGLAIAALIVLHRILEQHVNTTRGSKNWKKEAIILTHCRPDITASKGLR